MKEITDTPTLVDLSDLDAVTAGETPFEVEYIRKDGSGSGVFLLVLGGQSDKVQAEVNRLVNDRRKKQAQATAVGGAVEFTPIEDDIAFGHRLTAVRLVGWRGIKQDWSAENAFRLISRNSEIAEQVTAASNTLSNFMRLSSAA
ncbi:hypothetical protein [Caulobacter sp. RHG1]|uniref:hypothetical protein n=1 Tax=Caulobacter sp. (strain RHG1) TaxID=2545762 RepID=UPI001554BDD7|nr:hypothetical protein [Caulobacter sp. RHG1]NQE62957.1 hypothetical protein [Caulobacter sp. RHG1]